MGLLDGFLGKDWQDPQSQAVMALAGGLLSGNFGQGAKDYGNILAGAKDTEMKRKLIEMQMQEGQMRNEALRQQFADQTAMRGAAQSSFISPEKANAMSMGPTQDGGSVAPVQSGFDHKSYLGKLYGINPEAAIKYEQSLAKETPINKLDVKDFTPASVQKFSQTKNFGDLVRMDKLHFADTGGAIKGLDQFTGREVGQTAKTGNPFTDLIGQDANGVFGPNVPLIQAKKDIAKSGAANTSVKIENKMGEGVAAQIGPMIKDTYTAANGAAQQVDAARRIIKAVDSGKIISGPGSDVRMKVAQIGQILGVSGKDDAEIIANTRQVIRGLSEMTMQGRKQMTGQGAITESEGALAEKASSGRIEDLTPAEIKQLAKASARAAKFVYGQHSEMVKNLSENPNTAGLAKFYKPMPLGDVPEDAPAPGAIDSLVDKYRSR